MDTLRTQGVLTNKLVKTDSVPSARALIMDIVWVTSLATIEREGKQRHMVVRASSGRKANRRRYESMGQ
jgi:hypothetical protein